LPCSSQKAIPGFRFLRVESRVPDAIDESVDLAHEIVAENERRDHHG